MTTCAPDSARHGPTTALSKAARTSAIRDRTFCGGTSGAITLGNSSGCPDKTPVQGTLNDPYTGTVIAFTRGAGTSAAVQIDHIYPLSAAYDMGAWAWTDEQRINFAEDPINLLAVSGPANQSKSDSLPGTTPDRQGHSWMPPNSSYHCVYAQKLIAVAAKYALPIDEASVPVLTAALATCPAS